MGLESFRPDHVNQARKTGNTEALRAMGRKGGRKSAELRSLRKEQMDEHEKEVLRDMEEAAEQRRDDLLGEDNE